MGAAACLLAGLLLIAVGCGSERGEGFAIYLPARDVPPSQLATLSHMEIADTPLISGADVGSYAQDAHEIELTAQAFARITELEVPVAGRSFVVCVDRRPIYAGAFFTPISSLSFDGVVITKPLDSEAAAGGAHVIRIELGYPGPAFFSGEDPRADRAVLESLEQAGRLR